MTKSVTDSQSARERLDLLAAILAAGLLRLQSRKSSRNLPALGDTSLDCEGNSGGDGAAEIEISQP
jgi:hypothetical protein